MRSTWILSATLILGLAKLSSGAEAVLQSPTIDFGLSESTQYRSLNLRLSQTADKSLYCSSFQFRLAAAIFIEGISESSELLCGPRMVSDVYSAQIRNFSINPGEIVELQNLESNFFSELVRLRLNEKGEKAYFQTIDGNSFVVGQGNTLYVSDDELNQSGQLSFCPRPLDFQAVCTQGCAPGESSADGICERDTVQNVAMTGNSACALDHLGAVRCWGAQPISSPGEPGPLQTIVGSGKTICGVSKQGQLRCWGQLSSATPANAQLRWKAFALAPSRSCGITVQGQLLCFGIHSKIPSAIEDREDWSKVAVSDRDTCAIDRNGTMECWRNGILKAHPFPEKSMLAVMGGRKHFCAKATDGKLSCWGEGAGSEATPPEDMGPVKSFSVGYQHGCAIDTNDRLWCWGANESRQLEIPSTLGPVRSVVAGVNSTCALTEAGRFRCWGSTSSGISDLHPDL